jgi:plastocyanin
MTSLSSRTLPLALSLITCLTVVACSGDKEPEVVADIVTAPTEEGQAAGSRDGGSRSGRPTYQKGSSEQAPIDPATTGAIKGVALFDGEAPERKQLNISGTAGCNMPGHTALSERVIVTDGKLANVFVYVRGGLESWEVPEPSKDPLVLRQAGCMYAPHVSGIQVGQLLRIENDDQTTHNVHSRSKRNDSFNRTQAPKGAPLEYVFERREIMVPIVCDIHPWMKCWIGVVDHPFYAISAEDGTFTIEGLPAGEYQVSVWHEAYDTRKIKVTVATGDTTEVELSFP